MTSPISIKPPLCKEVSITRAPARGPAASTEAAIPAPLSCPPPICCKIEDEAWICHCGGAGAAAVLSEQLFALP